MIVPDVNVLVYAFRADAAEHDTYAAWLNRVIGVESIGVADVTLSGFVRVVTHPKVTSRPAPVGAAMEFVRHLLGAPRIHWLTSGGPAWEQFEQLTADDPKIRGNLVPDGYLAALCLANDAQLATRDRGFARFPGLRFFDPAR